MATPEIKSVGKAFALLDCLAAFEGSASLPLVAKRCGMNVATAHRLLATLETLGAVIHIGPGEYAIGFRLAELAHRSSLEAVLAASAAPVLGRITRATGATAHVAVLDGDYMVTYIARSAGRDARGATSPGNKLEAYCSGLGKVLLAALPEPLQERYLADGPFPALTQRTIIDPNALARELALVRERRYALDDGEMFDDLRCLAVPIMGRDGKTVAALSIAGSTKDIPKGRVPALVADLWRDAATISDKLFPNAATRAEPLLQASGH